MNADHWDDLAPRYDEEVFNVLAHDREGRLARQIAAAAGPRRCASDLGCGPGRFLPLLAENFQRVYAVDHSPQLVAQAERHCAEYHNIRYLVADVAGLADRLPPVHLALSVNALLTPALDRQRQMLDVFAEHVRPGGTLLLVVPSLESAHLTRQMLIEWNLREGATSVAALREGFPDASAREAQDARQGVLEVGGVPTKHFLREELLALLQLRTFRVQEIAKLRYPWTTEFHAPPEWMQAPYPWDWMVVAQRQRPRLRSRRAARGGGSVRAR